MPEIEIVSKLASELSLSLDNPRFPHNVKNEEEAILTFLTLKKVGPTKIKNIIKDIVKNKHIFEDFIVFKENGEYIVYDGNRRLVALKLFQENYLSLIKENYTSLYKFIIDTKKVFDINELVLNVKIYNDKSLMMKHILNLHTGEQGGVGQIKWDSNETESYKARYSQKEIPIGNQIYIKLKDDPIQSELYNLIKNKSYGTTFTRIFGFSDIKKTIFLLSYGEKINLNNPLHFNKVCEMITYFINENAKVGDVYSKSDAIDFFYTINPIEKNDDPKVDDTKIDSTKNDDPKIDDPKIDDPKIDDPKIDDPKNDDPKIDDPKIDDPKIDDPKIDDPKIDDPKIDDPKIDDPKNDDPKIDDPKNDDPKIDTPTRRRKNPEEFDYLLKAYKFNNKYRKNIRINQIMREIKLLPYKKNVVSSMFLIRTLLETYVNEYIDYFASLDRTNPFKLKNISPIRSKRTKTLKELVFTDIYNHLRYTIEDFPETYELIQTTFTDNNNTSTIQIIHFHVHSASTIPEGAEILDAWQKISQILKTLDELLSRHKI